MGLLSPSMDPTDETRPHLCLSGRYTLFKEADQDGSGVITYDEFKGIARRKVGLSEGATAHLHGPTY